MKAATILFVDDEQGVLNSVRRLLRREGWNLLLANSAAEGLQILGEQQVDVVVSDMMMSEMDGAKFLKQVKSLYPTTVRMILTGFSGREMVSRAFSEADIHEIITKPWDDAELKQILHSALEQGADQGRASPQLRRIINQMQTLPALPALYQELREATSENEVSAANVAQVIVKDPSIAAKVLQIANSAFFGQRRQIDTMNNAVVVLGTGLIETLVLSTSLFNSLDGSGVDGFDQPGLWRHSIGCGFLAHELARRGGWAKKRQETAMLAGTLHEIGKLICAQYLPGYDQMLESATAQGVAVQEVERSQTGTTHSEVGAYLADWWNMPDSIVDAIHYHDDPSQATVDRPLASLIHLADVLAQSAGTRDKNLGRSPDLDPETVEQAGLGDLALDVMTAEFQDLFDSAISNL